MNDKKQKGRYALRHKPTKSFVAEETPEGFWLIAEGNDNFKLCDVFKILAQFGAGNVDLKVSDFELVQLVTIVEPTDGQYSVVEIEEPYWLVGIEGIEDASVAPSQEATEPRRRHCVSIRHVSVPG